MATLHALFTRGTKEIRIKCLNILRNITFLHSNRITLLASKEYMDMLLKTFDTNDNYEMTISLSVIHKQIANSTKAKSIIKSSKFICKLNSLKKFTHMSENSMIIFENIIKLLC